MMLPCRWITSGSVLAGALALMLLGDPIHAEVTVKQWTFQGGSAQGKADYFSQSHRFWGSGQYPTDPSFLGKMVSLSTAGTQFLLWCTGKTDPADGKWRTGLGMAKPSKANWYQNGFYSVTIDGVSSASCPAEIGEVTGGDSGTATVIWRHPKATITTRLILLDGDDKLLVQTDVKAEVEFDTYQVELICYPSAMAGGYSPGLSTRDRAAVTAGRTLERPDHPDNLGTLSTTLEEDEPWVLFLDNHFDMADNRGEGPCAAAYSVREVTSAQVSVQNYPCQLRLVYPAAVTSSHIALWDFAGTSNADAIDYMQRLIVE